MRDEGSGVRCAVIKPYSILAPHSLLEPRWNWWMDSKSEVVTTILPLHCCWEAAVSPILHGCLLSHTRCMMLGLKDDDDDDYC